MDNTFYCWSQSNLKYFFITLEILSLTGYMSAYSRQRTLDSLVDLQSFDKNHRPPGIPNADSAVEVTIDMVFVTIGPVSDADMDIVSSFYMHQHWNDPRLKFNVSDKDESETHIISLEDLNHVWQPDLYFPKDKTTVSNEKLVPNKVAKLSSNGEMYVSERITSRSHCKLDLHLYPHDTQDCSLTITSYSHDDAELVMNWKESSSVTVETTVFIREFQLMGTETGICKVSKFFYGKPHSCLRVTHKLKRNQGFFLANLFIPYSLIVMFSWCGFWLDHTNLNSRISTSLLTLLATITLSGSNSKRLPRASYMKATDWWMMMCLIFVFLTFVEFRAVLYLSKMYKREKTLRYRQTLDLKEQKPNEKVDEQSVINFIGLDEPEHTNSSFVDQLQVINEGQILDLPIDVKKEKIESVGTPPKHSIESNSVDFDKKDQPIHTLKKQQSSVKKSSKGFYDIFGNAKTDASEDEFDHKNWGRQLDRICQLVFPISFFIWIFVYLVVFADVFHIMSP